MPPKKPPPEGAPPGPPSNGGNQDSGGDQDRFRGILEEFFQSNILPNLHRHLDEVVEAQIAKAKAESGLGDAEAVAQEAAKLLGPRISQDIQLVVNAMNSRLVNLEQGRGTAPTAPGPSESTAAPSPTIPTTGKVDLNGWLALGESLLDIAVTKLWPVYERQQMMKVMGEYGGLVPLFQHVRDTNPVMAQIGANIMAPDQLTNLMAMQIPMIATNAMVQGMRAKSIAQALAGNPQGGAGWPGIPSGGSPSSSLGLGVTPSGSIGGLPSGTPVPSGGANMTQRPKIKFKIRSRPQPSGPAKSATGPGSGPAQSLREVMG